MRSPNVQRIGIHLRAWRNRRQLSQLDLAGEAEISARHLSFLETGRATPSRDMVLRLADVLDVPVRERNVLLVSAGYAPSYAERDLEDASLAPARAVVDLMLERQKPYPAFASTLIVHGDCDASCPLELTGKRTAKLIKHAHLKVYEGAPHGLMLTHMDRLHADIESFIRETDLSPSTRYRPV